MMNFVLVAILLLHPTTLVGQTIKQLNEIAIDEELPIGAVATFLTDKIPNLDQSLEYDLVTASSADLDFFSIDHTRHALVMKKRLDYEQICRQATSPTCLIPISIAVSSQDTINVYILPIRVKNIDDHAMTFPVNQTVIEIEENDADWSTKSYALPRAVDDDGDSISYSLHLQNWNPPTGLFEFDEANLRLKPARQFDREEQNLYVLRLVAHNQYQKDLSLDVIIIIKDRNDHAPLCPPDPGLFTIDYRNAQSVYLVNATDLDEGDNSKLEYQLIDRVPGFEIDRFSGQLRFHSNRWIRTNQSKLIVNVADHGQPRRLSTQCTIEVQFPFLFDVNLKSNFGQVNRTDVIIAVQDVNVPLGQLEIIDKHAKSSCLNCSLRLNSSLPELFYLDSRTFELYLNLNSMTVRRILSNYVIAEENLPLSIDVHVWDTINPSLRSTKSISLILQFHKKKIARHSKMIFLNIDEHLSVNERISLANHSSHCFDSQVNDLILLDSTETFDLDQDAHLILKKPLNVAHQQQYQLLLKTPTNNRTTQTNQCSIQIRINVVNSYSIFRVYPYFSQSFYILTSNNLSQWSLPLLPSYVNYVTSQPNVISIDEHNRSIRIQSPSLFSSYAYDFQIEAIDTRTPSLSCAVSVRLFFGHNLLPPRLLTNASEQTIQLLSLESIYQMEAMDPDLSSRKEKHSAVPSIEYAIEPSIYVDIERYSGRLYIKASNQSRISSLINITLTMTDFGQPKRLVTRETLRLHLLLDERRSHREISMMMPSTLILAGACLSVMLVLFLAILLLCHCCSCRKPRVKSTATHSSTSWKNISPNTPDTRLIDHEYITTTTSLPRVIAREQRIYPTLSYDHQHKLLSNSSLDQIHLPPPPLYSAQTGSIRSDYQQHLSMNDINKYLERFEKIYNHSSEDNFRDPVGSVV